MVTEMCCFHKHSFFHECKFLSLYVRQFDEIYRSEMISVFVFNMLYFAMQKTLCVTKIQFSLFLVNLFKLLPFQASGILERADKLYVLFIS